MDLFFIILITLVLFYLLAIVCDEFFVPAIDVLSEKLKLPSDVAGATLLAAGSSAPELFASIIAIFGLAGASADIGSGTIVGSAIFNILVIIGVSALFKAVVLQWKPVIRDLTFYVLTILLLLFVFQDGSITIIEAGSFIVLYATYIYATLNWKKWFDYEDVKKSEDFEAISPKGFTLIVRRSIGYVIPDVKKKPNQYLATFFLSIIAIAVASYFLVEQLIHAADILSINPTFLALTVLAAGTSLPDLIGSIIVAKQGRGDMAVANAVGSNIFDILFGLGVPWFAYLLINGGNIKVSNENLISSILLLLATVIAIVVLLIIRKWKIGNRSGFLLIALYVAYVIYIILQN